MYSFDIDRGGTFTDFYVQTIVQGTIIEEDCFKVPSVSVEGEGPIVGIAKYMRAKGLMAEGDKIPTKFIDALNIGTTIATNALLERKGCKNVMIVTKGFKDLLTIRTQTRPNIFDLKCETTPPLCENVIEIDSRIYCCDLNVEGQELIQLGDKIFYQKPSELELSLLLEKIQKLKPQSIGISICNSYLSSQAQDDILQFLKKNGMDEIVIGSDFQEMGYLKRTETASLDAYLNPQIQKYFQQFLLHFDKPEDLKLKIMKSDGGFTSRTQVRASNMLLSGPAGGLVAYCRLANTLEEQFCLKADNMLGLDMGGTSTDISKVKGRNIVLNYSFESEGIEICTPHLQIETIAAGGGSQLGYSRGLLTVGPESVGSRPGPVCYGIGSQLALTDANLLLNRLDGSFFPRIFGKSGKEGINRELSIQAFERIAAEINSSLTQTKDIYELAEGFIEIANELMAKSARKILTLGRPDVLVIFGSAAGQHCCDIADKIGVSNIFIHRFSGILSAYGLSKAYETSEVKTYLGIEVEETSFDFGNLKKLIGEKKGQEKGVKYQFGKITEQVSIGYVGTSYTFKIPFTSNLIVQFQKMHAEENGFVLPHKRFKIEYYIQTFICFPKQYEFKEVISEAQDISSYFIDQIPVYFNGSFRPVKKYLLTKMKNCSIEGPVLLMSETSSIFVKENWKAQIINGSVKLSRSHRLEDEKKMVKVKTDDPIKLTIYSTRLMGIAQEMGKVLRKTSISTNIKERLDFSCGIFDWNGKLLANAPHLPVHLGSMETAVFQQIKRDIKPGDVVLTNHPSAGGSHLPDLTVVSCFQIHKGMNFYVASRGHHADIGGITPGSMPPFSKHLSEQGVAIEKFEMVKDGQLLQKELRDLFKNSRRIDDNISDLVAQISANEIGIKLLKNFVKESGIEQFETYVKLICENARECVEELLDNFSIKNGFPSLYSITDEQYMDDGTPLRLKLTLDRDSKRAIFDFSGTGPEVLGNTNAPKSITRSAVLYCLRSLIGKQIPLNSGCLVPVDIIVPQNSILNPSKDAAVVGGNVETSQKLVDLIFKPFGSVACSQGTMNNFLFGNEKYSYYQTICGGSGAGDGFSGKTVQCHMTNTRITDVEHLQRNYPVVLKQFAIREGSGGRGRYSGGNGVTREVLFLQKMDVSILSQRRIFPAYGLKGGHHGKVGSNSLITKQGVRKSIGSKSFFPVSPYDRVLIETPGGGGFGQIEE